MIGPGWVTFGFDRASARSPMQFVHGKHVCAFASAKVCAVAQATEPRQKSFARKSEGLRRPPQGRRAVMRSPQVKQGEGSAPALTEPVTAEAIASPSER